MSATRQPTTRRRRTRRTRVTVALGYPGHFRQVQFWDERVQVWCDYGDPVLASDKDVLEAKRARCERGE